MEVKAPLVVLIQKLRDTLNEESVANNKLMTRQLKWLLQSLSEEDGEFQKSRDYLFLLYEVDDEIDKFSFQVARQRKWFGFLMNQPLFFNNLNSCRVLIRKLNNFMTKIYCLPENHKAAATPISSIPSSSAVWPIPTIPSAKRGSLTRSFSTITHLHKKLTFSYSYNNDNVLPNVHDHQWSDEVSVKDYNDLCIDLKLCQALKLVLKSLATLVKLSHLNLLGNLERLPSANEFPPTVKVLTLSISQLSKDPMETLGQLPCLIVLRLLGDSFTGKRMVCRRGGFKQLEVLKMWKLTGLEEWDMEEEAMESLKELNIRHCQKLKNIPYRLLIKPRRLERIILTIMPNAFVDWIKKRISTYTTLITKH
ncbi:hypothetical protein L1987_11842 [Smallanthus sonchifolius]|uniref:Uncharacterized protein n=1 Tax=Smallanthus sonchifolius TaxID=185202 RepID=A0ACB9JCM8_9ASTR|nr:hypothetical protein L1987_11842 [Smallanthus sonchifolius]